MNRLILIALLLGGCATTAQRRVGTDIFFPPHGGGNGEGNFGAVTTIAQPDSAATPVTTFNAINGFSSNVHLADSSYWRIGGRSAGADAAFVQFNGTHLDLPLTSGQPGSPPLGLVSGLGALSIDSTANVIWEYDLSNNSYRRIGGGLYTHTQPYTTIGANDSVAMDATADNLQITVGSTNAQTITVTGLDTGKDVYYHICGVLPGNGNMNGVLRPNSAIGAWDSKLNYISNAAANVVIPGNEISYVDDEDSGHNALFCIDLTGAIGGNKVALVQFTTTTSAVNYQQWYRGTTTSTADITSLEFLQANNPLLPGSTITVERMRSINN